MIVDKDLQDMIFEMFDCGDPDVKSISSSGWIDAGKYSHRETIVEYNDINYKVCESRSGSYYTDYYYDEPAIFPVSKRIEMIETTFWDEIKV